MRVSEIIARTALSPSRLAGFAYTLNPYVGCSLGCVYCYSPAVLRRDRNLWSTDIGVKRNLPTLLARELKRLDHPSSAGGPDRWVAISSVTDGYQPLEARYRVTRHCLEQLVRHDWPVSILTKSHLFERDLDLLTRLSEVEVGLSVTTPDLEQQKLLEPGVAPLKKRLAALAKASGQGVKVYCYLGPLYPTTTLQEVQRLIKDIATAGAAKVMLDDLHLHAGVWEALKDSLGPERTKSWWEPLHDQGETYRRLAEVIRRACHHNGIKFELSELFGG